MITAIPAAVDGGNRGKKNIVAHAGGNVFF